MLAKRLDQLVAATSLYELYNIFDVTKVKKQEILPLVGFFGIVFFSISKFCFTLSLIKKFYLIDTRIRNCLLKKPRTQTKYPNMLKSTLHTTWKTSFQLKIQTR